MLCNWKHKQELTHLEANPVAQPPSRSDPAARPRSRGTRSPAPRSTSARWARPLLLPRLRARQLPLPRLRTSQAPLQPSARASSQASARQLPRPGLRAAPLPHEWNREQRGHSQRREDRGRVKESFYNQLEASQLYFNGKTNSSGT